MKTQTIKSIINSFECTSSDLTRYQLSGVLVTAKEIVATDGHKMSVVKHDDKDVFKNKDYWVSKEQLPLLKLILKSYARYTEEIEQVFCQDDSIEIKSLDSTPIVTQIKTCEALNVKYPNYKQLIPVHDMKTLRIGLNASYILELAKALKGPEGIKIPNITMTFKPSYKINADKSETLEGIDWQSPIIVERDGNTGVLMPVRL